MYLQGHFENRIMKKTFQVEVLEYGCDKESGLFIVKRFSEPIRCVSARYIDDWRFQLVYEKYVSRVLPCMIRKKVAQTSKVYLKQDLKLRDFI